VDQAPEIRAGRVHEIERMRQVEREAGAAFRDIGMDAIAEDAPLSAEALEAYVVDNRALVAVTDDDRIAGYLLLDSVDDAGHVAQVSVDPAYRGRRIGRQLIDAAGSWAAEAGHERLTLTTFENVPWNAPYYERLGFTHVPEADLSPGLRSLRRHEAELGLDRWPRTVMARGLPSTPDSGAD
jgi:GNAT superfamily N-acetyltransferase